nr:glutamine synthetase leaf isozyme, chloroplastic [Ipomoea batatas]
MAQILAPSAQWQMRIAKSSTEASPMASKMWGSVVMKPNKRLAVKSSAKFRVFALQSENSTVNRMEQLLNLDVTPYTDKIIAEYIWYGIEQEYTLLQQNVKWPVGGYPGPQGPYYCGAGADKSFGRDISDAHYKACLYAGSNFSGTNGEAMPGQWDFQVGPSVGIEAGDHIWCARYILERITEQAGVVLSLDCIQSL